MAQPEDLERELRRAVRVLDLLEELQGETIRYLHLALRHGLPEPPRFDACNYEPCAAWHRHLARRGRA